MTTDRCTLCRAEAVVTYLDRPLCWDHWCDVTCDETETKTLAMLGLIRDDGGQVSETKEVI